MNEQRRGKDLRVLLIVKKDDFYSARAAEFVKGHFINATIVQSARDIPFPEELFQWEGELIISYLAQWIIPQALLEKATMAAINFHPGPPAYPGIGCTNFAIYNEEKEFGITCHQMLARVDSGHIIEVRYFPVFEEDTVYSLTQRCYAEILHLFYTIASKILLGQPLPKSNDNWLRKPYTRKQLNALCELTPDMSQEEINKRLKATTFGEKVWAYMKAGEGDIS